MRRRGRKRREKKNGGKENNSSLMSYPIDDYYSFSLYRQPIEQQQQSPVLATILTGKRLDYHDVLLFFVLWKDSWQKDFLSLFGPWLFIRLAKKDQRIVLLIFFSLVLFFNRKKPMAIIESVIPKLLIVFLFCQRVSSRRFASVCSFSKSSRRLYWSTHTYTVDVWRMKIGLK